MLQQADIHARRITFLHPNGSLAGANRPEELTGLWPVFSFHSPTKKAKMNSTHAIVLASFAFAIAVVVLALREERRRRSPAPAWFRFGMIWVILVAEVVVFFWYVTTQVM